MEEIFYQIVKKDLRTYDNIQKIGTGQGDDYTTVCLINYSYFEKYYKLIAIDLSKQKNLMLIQKQDNRLFLVEIQKNIMKQCFSMLKKQNKSFRFFTRNRESIVILCFFNEISK